MYSEKQYTRLTKLELDIKYNVADINASVAEAGRQRVALLMKNCKCFWHPDFPGNKTMRMYRVLNNMTDGQRKATKHLTDLKAEGAVNDPDAAIHLIESHEKDEAMLSSFSAGDPEKDAELGSADKKREAKELSPAQEEAKKVKAEKTKNSVFMKRLIRDINTNKNKVEQTIGKLNGLPESGGSGITGAIAALKSFLEPLHKLLD